VLFSPVFASPNLRPPALGSSAKVPPRPQSLSSPSPLPVRRLLRPDRGDLRGLCVEMSPSLRSNLPVQPSAALQMFVNPALQTAVLCHPMHQNQKSRPLFSIACALFCNYGGGGGWSLQASLSRLNPQQSHSLSRRPSGDAPQAASSRFSAPNPQAASSRSSAASHQAPPSRFSAANCQAASSRFSAANHQASPSRCSAANSESASSRSRARYWHAARGICFFSDSSASLTSFMSSSLTPLESALTSQLRVSPCFDRNRPPAAPVESTFTGSASVTSLESALPGASPITSLRHRDRRVVIQTFLRRVIRDRRGTPGAPGAASAPRFTRT